MAGSFVEGTLFADWVEAGRGWMVLVVLCLAQILSGGLWPVLSIAVSTWIRNPYVSLAAPFAVCLLSELLQVIVQTPFVSLYIFYFQYYETGKMRDSGLIWIFGEIVLLLVVFAGLFWLGMKRRFREDG